jgi:hypothetical protein
MHQPQERSSLSGRACHSLDRRHAMLWQGVRVTSEDDDPGS